MAHQVPRENLHGLHAYSVDTERTTMNAAIKNSNHKVSRVATGAIGLIVLLSGGALLGIGLHAGTARMWQVGAVVAGGGALSLTAFTVLSVKARNNSKAHEQEFTVFRETPISREEYVAAVNSPEELAFVLGLEGQDVAQYIPTMDEEGRARILQHFQGLDDAAKGNFFATLLERDINVFTEHLAELHPFYSELPAESKSGLLTVLLSRNMGFVYANYNELLPFYTELEDEEKRNFMEMLVATNAGWTLVNMESLRQFYADMSIDSQTAFLRALVVADEAFVRDQLTDLLEFARDLNSEEQRALLTTLLDVSQVAVTDQLAQVLPICLDFAPDAQVAFLRALQAVDPVTVMTNLGALLPIYALMTPEEKFQFLVGIEAGWCQGHTGQIIPFYAELSVEHKLQFIARLETINHEYIADRWGLWEDGAVVDRAYNALPDDQVRRRLMSNIAEVINAMRDGGLYWARVQLRYHGGRSPHLVAMTSGYLNDVAKGEGLVAAFIAVQDSPKSFKKKVYGNDKLISDKQRRREFALDVLEHLAGEDRDSILKKLNSRSEDRTAKLAGILRGQVATRLAPLPPSRQALCTALGVELEAFPSTEDSPPGTSGGSGPVGTSSSPAATSSDIASTS